MLAPRSTIGQACPMRRVGTVVMAAALGFAGLAGCSGGDEEAIPDTVAEYVPPEGITVEEWRAQMTAVCEDFAAQPNPFAGRAEPDDPDEAMALIEELLPVVDGFVSDLEAVPAPAGRVRDQEQLQQDIAEYRGAVEQGRGAAAERDPTGVYAMIRELNRQGAVLDARLTALGVTACAE
jgi:hypothetical protein